MKGQKEGNRVIETRTARIWVDRDGIVRYKILPRASVTLADSEEYVKIQSGITAGRSSLNLTDLREVEFISREARNYLSGKDSREITTACALLIGSPISKVIGNFFLGLNKPPYPTRLFTSEDEAVRWLKGFV